MTPIEDPASVTIPSTTTKETTDHEFVTSATNTSVLNTSGSNATAENAQNQSQDGQKDTARLNVSNDAEAIDRKSSFFSIFFNSNKLEKSQFVSIEYSKSGEHDYVNVNGNSARATVVKSEEDVCDNKANKQKSEPYSNNSNNTRTLTQQSSLVAPSEVHISISPALTAEPVLTLNGKLLLLNYQCHYLLKNVH